MWMQWSSWQGTGMSVPLCHSNGLWRGGQRGWGQTLCPSSSLLQTGRLLVLLRPARRRWGSCCDGTGGPGWRLWSPSSPCWGWAGSPCPSGFVFGAMVWTLACGGAVQPSGLRTGLADQYPRGGSGSEGDAVQWLPVSFFLKFKLLKNKSLHSPNKLFTSAFQP